MKKFLGCAVFAGLFCLASCARKQVCDTNEVALTGSFHFTMMRGASYVLTNIDKTSDNAKQYLGKSVLVDEEGISDAWKVVDRPGKRVTLYGTFIVKRIPEERPFLHVRRAENAP
jgi:hypothetical protein